MQTTAEFATIPDKNFPDNPFLIIFNEENNFFTLANSSLRNEHYLQTKQYTLNIKKPYKYIKQ